MTASRLYVDPTVGAPVFTRDGKKVGTVKDLAGGSFKVGVHWRRDFWLSTDEVERANPFAVHLLVDDNELWAYKLERPAGVAPEVDPHDDQLISDQERMLQRQRMEQEIAEARQDLYN
ncbi:MAG: PRC-barrel domain-containing protein [Chloroflexi bacterium]|nr:PRC-barrel domain-containing protein [Chloroflexota bacterium]